MGSARHVSVGFCLIVRSRVTSIADTQGCRDELNRNCRTDFLTGERCAALMAQVPKVSIAAVHCVWNVNCSKNIIFQLSLFGQRCQLSILICPY